MAERAGRPTTTKAKPPIKALRKEPKRFPKYERFQGYEAPARAQPGWWRRRRQAAAERQPGIRFQRSRRREGARQRPARLREVPAAGARRERLGRPGSGRELPP